MGLSFFSAPRGNRQRPRLPPPFPARSAASLRRALHASARALAPFRILASDPIDPICGKLLRERGCEVVECAKTPTPDALLAQIGEFDGLVIRSATTVTKDVLAAGKRLKVIGRAGVGVDNIDVPAATRCVFLAPGLDARIAPFS